MTVTEGDYSTMAALLSGALAFSALLMWRSKDAKADVFLMLGAAGSSGVAAAAMALL